MGRQVLTIADYSGETSTTTFNCVDMTAANFDTVNTALDAIQAAVDGVSIGVIRKDARVATEEEVATGNPASQYAQRESKWLVVARDNVNNKIVRTEIACPDLTLLVPGTDLMNIAAGAGQTLVNALNANMLSVDGNAVTVQYVTHVGRNL